MANTATSSASQLDPTLTDSYCVQDRAVYQDDQPAQQRVGVSARYTSGFRETAIDATGDPLACLYNNTYCHVASFIDMDLTGIYKFNDHLSTSFTVASLLDRPPPIDPADYAGQNYNPTYAQAGIIGHFFKIAVSYEL